MDVKTTEPMSSNRMETLMEPRPVGRVEKPEKTWKPVAAGILAILAGYVNIMAGFYSGVFMVTGRFALYGLSQGTPLEILAIVLGVVSVIGGAFAIARRSYPLALIGSIASALFLTPAVVAGALSLIFVSLSRHEFQRR